MAKQDKCRICERSLAAHSLTELRGCQRENERRWADEFRAQVELSERRVLERELASNG